MLVSQGPLAQAILSPYKLPRNQFDKVILNDEQSCGVAGGVAFAYHQIPIKCKALWNIMRLGIFSQLKDLPKANGSPSHQWHSWKSNSLDMLDSVLKVYLAGDFLLEMWNGQIFMS